MSAIGLQALLVLASGAQPQARKYSCVPVDETLILGEVDCGMHIATTQCC